MIEIQGIESIRKSSCRIYFIAMAWPIAGELCCMQKQGGCKDLVSPCAFQFLVSAFCLVNALIAAKIN